MSRHDSLFTILIALSIMLTVRSQPVSNSTNAPSNETEQDSSQSMPGNSNPPLSQNLNGTEENMTSSDSTMANSQMSNYSVLSNSTQQVNDTDVRNDTTGTVDQIQSFGRGIDFQAIVNTSEADSESNATRSEDGKGEGNGQEGSEEETEQSVKPEQSSAGGTPSDISTPTVPASENIYPSHDGQHNISSSSGQQLIGGLNPVICPPIAHFLNDGDKCMNAHTCRIKPSISKCVVKGKCIATAQTNACQMGCELISYLFRSDNGVEQSAIFNYVRVALKGENGLFSKRIFYRTNQEQVMAAFSERITGHLNSVQVVSLFAKLSNCDETGVVP